MGARIDFEDLPKAEDGYPAPQFPRIADLIRGRPLAAVRELLVAMDEQDLVAMMTDPSLWELEYQRPPPGDWLTWVLRCGRMAGKTHTGSREINDAARDKEALGGGDIGIWGATYSDVTGTMVRGPSGILATAPVDFQPKLVHRDGTLILLWPNGVVGHLLSEDARERGRGKNLARVWADELCAWMKPKYTWDYIINPSLRMGDCRAIVTTTPADDDDGFLEELEGRASTVVTEAPSFLNPFLPAVKRQELIDIYGGTRLELQELWGQRLGLAEDALWHQEWIDAARMDRHPPMSEMQRIVVGVDPAVTAHEDSDETGIVVAGIDYDGRIYVMRDRSLVGTPPVWGSKVADLYRHFKCDRVVAEVNNGGDLVESNIKVADPSVAVKQVRASRGKITRAEPVAALYEKGLVSHCGHFPELEKQLVGWSPKKKKSPDRLDALVWAITDLALGDDANKGPATAYAKAYRGMGKRRRRR